MKKAILILSLFLASRSYSFDAKLASGVFDFPFGWDPIVEQYEINGQPEIRVTYRTEVPFDLLKAYYVESLKKDAWTYLPFDQFIPEILPGSPQRMLFMGKTMILVFLYFEAENQRRVTLSLREGLPNPVPDMKTVESSQIEGIRIYGATPMLQFRSTTGPMGDTLLMVFKTDSGGDYVMDCYSRELGDKGWEESKMLDTFAEELTKLAPVQGTPIRIKGLKFFRKNGNFLFLFVSPETDKSGTVFGYFLRKSGDFTAF